MSVVVFLILAVFFGVFPDSGIPLGQVLGDGFVHFIQDGEKEVKEEHLYAKYLYLGSMDDINDYKLVKDPKAKVN